MTTTQPPTVTGTDSRLRLVVNVAKNRGELDAIADVEAAAVAKRAARRLDEVHDVAFNRLSPREIELLADGLRALLVGPDDEELLSDLLQRLDVAQALR